MNRTRWKTCWLLRQYQFDIPKFLGIKISYGATIAIATVITGTPLLLGTEDDSEQIFDGAPRWISVTFTVVFIISASIMGQVVPSLTVFYFNKLHRFKSSYPSSIKKEERLLSLFKVLRVYLLVFTTGATMASLSTLVGNGNNWPFTLALCIFVFSYICGLNIAERYSGISSER